MKLIPKYMLILLIFILTSGCSIINRHKEISSITSQCETNKFNPKILWKIHVGRGINNFYSNLNPTCYKNILFVANRFGIIKAIDIKNGIEKWSIDLSTKGTFSFIKKYNKSALLSGGISANNHFIFIGSEDGKVYGINSHDGKIIWKTQVLGESLSNPVLYKNNIFIHTGNAFLQCLNAQNGIIKWSLNLSVLDDLSIRGESSPAIAFGNVIIGDDNGRISSINIKTGKIVWQKSIANFNHGSDEINYIHDIDTTPVIINNKIYAISYNGNLAILDFKSGNILWQYNIGSLKNIIVINKHIYAVDQNNKILCVDIINKKIIWNQKSFSHLQLTAPVLYDNYLILGDNQGYLYWINIHNGKCINQKKIDDSGFQAEFLVAQHKLFIQSKSGMIYAIEDLLKK